LASGYALPAGGGMSLELSLDSFRKAFKFFDNYFPEKVAKAVVCHSWIFSPILKNILPPHSNLVKLQNNICLYPISKNCRDGFFFIFGSVGETAKLEELPKDTSLQRSILNYVSDGKPWFGGGMFILRDSVEGNEIGKTIKNVNCGISKV
jgi:hypothetical protein